MKKILVAATAAFVFLTTGCSGFLDEELKSSLAPNNTYTSSYGFEVGVTGLYAYARAEYNTWGGSASSHGQACPYEALQVATDIVVTGHKDGSLVPFENLSYSPSTTFVNSYWNWAYGLISSANELLEKSDNPDVKWDKATDKSLFQAEARFFRAYAYRSLVYLYGDVPYVDKIEKSFRIDFTRTAKAEVLGKMIDDLKFAAQYLPENPDKVQTGKLTTWAARHLLSEVYLMAAKYPEAETVAKEVIASGNYQLMNARFGANKDKAGDPFSDMFLEYNQNRTSGNKESIWVMQLEYNTTGGGGEYEDWTKRAWVPKYYNLNGFTLADTLGGRGLAQIVPMKWWINDANFFEEGDIRNSEYSIKRDWYYNNPAVADKYGKKAEITNATWAAGTLFPAVTKYFYGKSDNLSYGGNNKDRMKFRLAETYLLLAEAHLMQNHKKEAADAINEVRKRSHAPLIDESQASVDFLLDERIRELIGEESRRFTLVRFGKLKERTLKYNPNTQNMEDYHALWPIPQTIIDSNTGAEFPQNQGY
ncbi:MAG: RagB/SusD family nutrient uptake outer membrane protein [Macellibacteroides fermentans]|uniref:RagB/SusD family nutrient uptake outer membrane protein n=1 Tax=Macellibacteroides fermentans TaxID=879969 RepID=UPI003ACB4A9D